MGKILDFYTKYRKDVPDYNKWNAEQNKKQVVTTPAPISMQKKAKLIAEPMLLFDKYEHEKMEDAETFYQTFNIEVMSLVGAISSLPITITKIPKLFKNKAQDNQLLKSVLNGIEKYSKKTINLAKKTIPLPKALTSIGALLGGLVLMLGIKHSMTSQLGIIRKASFDATQNVINDPKIFIDLNPKQEEKLSQFVSDDIKNENSLVNKLQDKMDLNSSFKTVSDFSKNKSNYNNQKNNYFYQQKLDNEKNISLPVKEMMAAKEEKEVLKSYLKNVEHSVLEDLRKVETISNISYSAMFTGGFLEYLMTDKLVSVLGIKNKPLQMFVKLAVPLLTYFLLNKNISDIENKAILATKYKHLKEFMKNPQLYAKPQKKEKQSLPEFIKMMAKDMSDYSVFAEKELPLIEERLEAKKQLEYSDEQIHNAKRLQKNTSMILNKHREHLYAQSVGIKSFSETILGPIDVVSTALGASLGSLIAKHVPKVKSNTLFKAVGAVIAFIPAAYIEAVLTKQQKLSEKTAVMKATNELKDSKQFALKNHNKQQNTTTNLLKYYSAK